MLATGVWTEAAELPSVIIKRNFDVETKKMAMGRWNHSMGLRRWGEMEEKKRPRISDCFVDKMGSNPPLAAKGQVSGSFGEVAAESRIPPA